MVRIQVDLGVLEDWPSDRLVGFNSSLLKALPTLERHGCCYGQPGGFIRRLEAGTVELQDTAIRVPAVVEEVMAAAAPMAAAKGLTLGATLDPELPQHLAGDAMRISQVLTNLVQNACKFTEEGHVRVTLHDEAATDRLLVALRELT